SRRTVWEVGCHWVTIVLHRSRNGSRRHSLRVCCPVARDLASQWPIFRYTNRILYMRILGWEISPTPQPILADASTRRFLFMGHRSGRDALRFQLGDSASLWWLA